jgi:NADP-dependent 3-hydroxy acid dehydrogenase YdfG
MRKLEDKVAVITGATSGMALATAKLFVEEAAFEALMDIFAQYKITFLNARER